MYMLKKTTLLKEGSFNNTAWKLLNNIRRSLSIDEGFIILLGSGICSYAKQDDIAPQFIVFMSSDETHSDSENETLHHQWNTEFATA